MLVVIFAIFFQNVDGLDKMMHKDFRIHKTL